MQGHPLGVGWSGRRGYQGGRDLIMVWGCGEAQGSGGGTAVSLTVMNNLPWLPIKIAENRQTPVCPLYLAGSGFLHSTYVT